MVKKLFFLMLLCTTTVFGFAQTATTTIKDTKTKEQQKQERKDRINKLAKEYEEGSLIFAKQSTFAFKLNTDGWGAFYEHGKYKTINSTNLWSIEFGERKSPKEEKFSVPLQDGSGFVFFGNPYIFGKRNNFYYLKANVGQQKLIGGKGNKNGVAVSAVYGGGISLGYLKPYYISVNEGSGLVDIKYSDSTEDQFLEWRDIAGGSGFTKGFTEGKLVPGVNAKLGMRFDYGRYNEFLSAIEVGVNAEYYTKTMPILINNPEKKFFFNGYIAFEFGRRK